MRDQLIIFTKNQKLRRGRGFSRNELKKAGLGLRQAHLKGLPTDSRRRTAHAENVKLIKRYLKNPEPASKR